MRRATGLPTPRQFAKGSSSGIADHNFTQNPCDVTDQRGATVDFAKSHAVYFNPGGECTIASCWGDPERFLDDVGESDFIHILDQYVGLHGDNRYTLGRRAVLKGALPTTPLLESDLIAILHGLVAKTGASVRAHFPPFCRRRRYLPCARHLLLADTRDLAFCAYHDIITHTDCGMLFTVEPWQGPLGMRGLSRRRS